MLPPTLITPDQLRALLVTVIAGVKGEPEARWIKIVGEVEALPAWRYPVWNWRVHPKGTRAQVATVEQCVDIVKAERPLVSG